MAGENIFLVGMMGAGKTTVGRELARRLGKHFIDCDHELEARTGVRVSTIFQLEGEEGFRRREAQLIDELTTSQDVVLATGGGAVLRPENRAHLRERGVVVYLRVQPQHLWMRTRHDRNRPLLQVEDPLRRIEELYAVRDPLYLDVAHLIIESGGGGARTVVRKLMGRLEARCNP
jgi:shikimate kinase